MSQPGGVREHTYKVHIEIDALQEHHDHKPFLKTYEFLFIYSAKDYLSSVLAFSAEAASESSYSAATSSALRS